MTTTINIQRPRPSPKPVIVKPITQLEVHDLLTLAIPVKIQDDFLIIERSARGSKLRHPVNLDLAKVLAVGEKGLVAYILAAFTPERPGLMPFVFDNQSLIRLAKHFLRHCSGSIHSLYSYTCTVHKYSAWLGHSPDLVIQDVKPAGNIPDPLRVQNHVGFLEDYIASLQDEGLSPGRVHCYAKHIRTFFRVNGVKIELNEPLSRRVTYKDRSPTPEELTRVLEIANLRERVLVSMLALGAFREETLAKLKYRHVQEDLSRGIVPVHVHVEAEIVKGKYGDYDTFLGSEATEYLTFYLDMRRRGNPKNGNPPETLTAESPLIRNEKSSIPKSIGSKQVRKIVHGLYMKAGLLKAPKGRMYELRVHSLRKFFKTQLLALGVQPDYVDYMMGHTVDIYNDIEMKGVEFLRNIYASSGLSIRPRTKVSRVDALKEIIRAWGLDPEKILSKDALVEPHRTVVDFQNREDSQLQVLSKALRDIIRQEATGQMRIQDGGPEGN